eukprot:SAG11_NODE_18717_length_483_cov_0.937500_1_plen_59_part_10
MPHHAWTDCVSNTIDAECTAHCLPVWQPTSKAATNTWKCQPTAEGDAGEWVDGNMECAN